MARKKRTVWTFELVQKEALKYNSKKEFCKNSKGAYNWAYKNKVLNQISLHMERRLIWNLELVKIEALKYQTTNDFLKNASGAYQWAYKHNKLDVVSSHFINQNKSKWTIESIKKESLKYNKLSDFYKNSKSAYNWTLRNGLLDTICSHMEKRKVSVKTIWTFELVQKEALKYKRFSDFYTKSKNAYIWAQKRKILEEISSHMVKRTTWNLELVQKEALKYINKNEFRKHAGGAYQWARNNNKLNIISKHMDANNLNKFTWTLDLVKKEALKYEFKKDFKKLSNSAYDWSIRNKVLEEISSHMKVLRIIWTLDLVKKEALKYESKQDFSKYSNSAYKWARENNCLNKVCSKMSNGRFLWNYESVQKEALKYEMKTDFQKKSGGAYHWALKNNVLQDISKHLKQGSKGFNINKRGFVYYIRIDKDGDTVYKIGITNYDLERRFGKSKMKYITPIYSWEYENGYDARKLEKEILTDYSHAKYKGPDIFQNGNTEMFVDDILMLDKQNLEIA